MQYKHFIFCAFTFFVSLILLGSSVASDSSSNAVTNRGGEYGNEDLSVSADFDGDGIEDRAYFTKTSKGFNLIATSGENKFILVTLKSIANVGIAKGTPGIFAPRKDAPRFHRRLCSYNSTETCNKEHYKEHYRDKKTRRRFDVYEVKGDSISFFHSEGASRVYYWTSNRFTGIWLSD